MSYLKEIEKEGKYLASQEAIRKKEEELRRILEEEIPANAEEIRKAQALGDLRENAEYKAALEKHSILQATAERLEQEIKQAIPLKTLPIQKEYVTVGTRVKLKELSTGDIFSYTILDQWDADIDRGIISFRSPLGKSLLLKRKGEKVEFHEQKFEILDIDKGIDEEGNPL